MNCPYIFSVNAPDFNLGHTLECGQVFRWDRAGPSLYEGVVGPEILRIRAEKENLLIETSGRRMGPSRIRSYFDLDLDLAYIYNTICKDKHIRAAVRRFRGLRIIRQPLWECAASFIISAYNNIPRIKGIIYNLSKCSGRPLILNGKANYSFPEPRVMADLGISGLKRCGTGFRAPYLKKAAKAFLAGAINADDLRNQPYEAAKDILMGLDGVGDKVADCILLYSLGRFEAFPVDVWIKRVMERLYFKGKKTGEEKIRQFAREYFGQYAGYAQQYLYHYARRNDE